MGRLRLILRLGVKDVRRNRAEAVLLLVAIVAATSTLSVALALHGVTSAPYAATRAATDGPDVIAAVQEQAIPKYLTALEHAPGVSGHGGPYQLDFGPLVRNGHQDPVMIEGRSSSMVGIDQPEVTAGTWVRPGGAVIERSLAELLGLKVGDRFTLSVAGGPLNNPSGGVKFVVAGVAVTAALQPTLLSDTDHPSGFAEPGLVWVTTADVQKLSAFSGSVFGYTLNLRLSNPATAPAFAARYQRGVDMALTSWQSMAKRDGLIISIEQAILITGSSLLGLLALASVALLVGGRMEQQTRRVGLLKAVGASPSFVAQVLLVEQVVLALIAAALGLVIGLLAAPLLTKPGASLVGAPGAPSLDLANVAIVLGAALAVAVIATLSPALRAARTSTVSALADAPRTVRRARLSTWLSARLPIPLMLGMRFASRRRRRAVLSAASVAITVGTLVTVLMFRRRAQVVTGFGQYRFSGPGDPLWERGIDVMWVFTIALVIVALINAILVTWATVQDARHAAAVERALGASPSQIGWALVVTQLLPAFPGALIGIPFGAVLFFAVGHDSASLPSALLLAGVVLVTLAVVAALTAIPARVGARRSVVEILQSETA